MQTCGLLRFLVRLTGLEPAILSEIDPKSIVYANFTTGADGGNSDLYIVLQNLGFVKSFPSGERIFFLLSSSRISLQKKQEFSLFGIYKRAFPCYNKREYFLEHGVQNLWK